MAFGARFLSTAAVIAGLAVAPAAHADHWHGGWGYRGGGYYHHHNNNAAGAAIIGGLLGLGVGAAIASGNGYYGAPSYYGAPGYYAPPPAYYAPPRAYYTPAPPAVYYGY
jgi:hypothetical protein